MMMIQNVFTHEVERQHYNNTMKWGSYRPGVFFGMKTRSTKPFITGLIWNRGDTAHGIRNIRHQSEMNQHISYGWDMHDGKSFGVQTIVDRENSLILTTEMVKSDGSSNGDNTVTRGGDWTVRITGKHKKGGNEFPEQPAYISLAFYFGFENDADSFRISGVEGTRSKGIPSPIIMTGESEDLGPFSIYVKDSIQSNPDTNPISQSFNFIGAKLPAKEIWKVKDITQELYKRSYKAQYDEQMSQVTNPETHQMKPIYARLPNQMEDDSNIIVIQKIVKAPFQLDIVFLSDELHPDFYAVSEVAEEGEKQVDQFTNIVEQKKTSFSKQFADKFFSTGTYSQVEKEMAMFALSNMIGSLGYFHGDSFHKYGENSQPVVVSPYSLFSAVPARSFFPRGFLWDEGFHQLLISRWDKQISQDIIAHWFNTMTKEGWIPREQILGDEARSRVPQEFQVQHDTHANPPMLFITILHFMNSLKQRQQKLVESGVPDVQIQLETDTTEIENGREYLKKMYPLLLKNYKWIVKTQQGPKPFSFRWRGRTPGHTLASGLDDYPRGNEEPQTSERHLDLVCWVYMMTDVLQQMRDFLDIDRNQNDLRETLQGIKSNLKSMYCYLLFLTRY
jgi:mannosyl-oligosaccharide glucosidase